MLDWLLAIPTTSPVAHAVGLLALTCAAGMAVGSIKVKGIGLGSAGVLFMGILIAHFTQAIDKPTLDFVKEFGLVLFVFTIGLQLGPGFFASLKSEGLNLISLLNKPGAGRFGQRIVLGKWRATRRRLLPARCVPVPDSWLAWRPGRACCRTRR